jgi:hypothetical protein
MDNIYTQIPGQMPVLQTLQADQLAGLAQPQMWYQLVPQQQNSQFQDPTKPTKSANNQFQYLPTMFALNGLQFQNPFGQLSMPIQGQQSLVGMQNLQVPTQAPTQTPTAPQMTEQAPVIVNVSQSNTVSASPIQVKKEVSSVQVKKEVNTKQNVAQKRVISKTQKRIIKTTGKKGKKRRRVSVKLCNIEGCTKLARSTTLFCAAHGGGRRCMTPNCSKAARGSTSFCIAHGGGRRCRAPLCTKSAQGSTYFCIGHGGGRRCKNPSCTKSARGPAGFCKSHGGGKKCAHPQCSKSAADGTLHCRPHGGGVRCAQNGCARSVKKNESFCPAHEGAVKKTAVDVPAIKTNSNGVVVPLNSIAA